MYQLNWKSSQAYGSEVIAYQLEGLIIDIGYKERAFVSKGSDTNKHWNVYYNGTDNYWNVTKNINEKYVFRVRAGNVYGFSAWSNTSEIIDFTESGTFFSSSLLPTLIFPLGAIGIVITCVCTFFCRKYAHLM